MAQAGQVTSESQARVAPSRRCSWAVAPCSLPEAQAGLSTWGGLVLPTLHDSGGRGACGKADLRLAALMGLRKVLCWGLGGQGSGLISSGCSGNPLPR